MFIVADLPPAEIPNPPAHVSLETADAPKLPKLPEQVREQAKQQEKEKVVAKNLAFTCHGNDFCNGQMSAAEVRRTMSSAFSVIQKLDPELAQVLTRDGVQVGFTAERQEVMSFLSTDNIQISDNLRVNLWNNAIPNIDVIADLYKDDFFKFVPFKFAVPNGLDAITATMFTNKDGKAYSLGNVVLITDKMFKEIPEEFKKDPILKKAYECVCMIALTSHEGYHLEQFENPKKGDLIDINKAASQAAIEVDAYSKGIKFLEKLRLMFDNKDGKRAEVMRDVLDHVIKNEKKQLDLWKSKLSR